MKQSQSPDDCTRPCCQTVTEGVGGSGQGGGSGSSTPDWTDGGMQKTDHHCAIPVMETSGQGARRQEETKREKGLG